MTAAQIGLAHWFFGNLYEGLVDVPRLLADAQPHSTPRLLGPGSPIRYFAPAAPLTFGTTAAALLHSWRSGGPQRATVTAAVSVTSALAMSGYLIRTVNLRLLRADEPLTAHERRQLVRTWHRVNAVRLAALGAALVAISRPGVMDDDADT